MMGSAPAEQNHSSICKHLGNGANWTVSENIQQLIERQQTLEKSFTHFDNKLDLVGSDKKDEETAKRALTKYGFDHLFTRARAASRELSMKTLPDGAVQLWPHYRDQGDNQTISILPGERCKCVHRLAFQHQCCHELAHDRRFILDKYDPRWIMNKVFCQTFPFVCQVPNREDPSHDMVIESVNQTSVDVDNHLDITTNIQDREMVEHEDMVDLTDTLSNGSNYSYKFLYSRCSELCRAAGHDKPAMAAVVSLVDEATERLRMGLHINPTWTDIPHQNNTENVPPQPLPAIYAHHTRPTEQL
jgi:hypothetical protein